MKQAIFMERKPGYLMKKKEKTTLTGWGNYPLADSAFCLLRSAEDAREAIREEVIARGLGRSYADQAINQGRLVAGTTGLNKFLSFDEEKGILACEAGVNLEEIISAFAPRKWFPFICPGTKFVTVGGAIANDIHGKAHHIDGSFVNAVIDFTILLADGRVLTASRTENADLFWANFGGLGLLGIILTATLQLRRIETCYFKQRSFKVKNLESWFTVLEESDRSFNYSVGWIDPQARGKDLGKGVLSAGNSASLEDLPAKFRSEPLKLHGAGKLNLPVFLPDFTLNNFTSFFVNRALSFMLSSNKDIVHYDSFFFPLDIMNNWNRGYGERGFIQYQFVLPRETGAQSMRAILESIVDSGCTPFLNVFKTLGKAQGILSFPFEGYTLAIDFPMSEKLKTFIPTLDKKVMDAGGRIYLGKDAMLNAATFRHMYPQLDEWMQIKKKYDPQNRFTSNISRRLEMNPSASFTGY